ncbi:chlorophyll a/b binding light-harvesting protein [Acaryochloris marina]|uniref:chlorophyll a/b binding light-harvesting protein n=1 Tax=Acaryochloris marina TaxID=155978 RepID=UPI0021C28C1D|nr:chlorophyll a/b binding light-harvesting protein [Acaryochloris marina]BDM77374.1 iron stress-induced chlorophyll-binding protein [Acaryochloris marina MBIC10699]
MQTYGQPKVNYPWYAGNARYTGFSAQFLAAHIGQIASMCFFAGTFTIYELSRYDPDLPLYSQNFVCLPQLAREGFGVGSGGVIVDTYIYFAIGMIHLFAAAVFASGALYHIVTGPKNFADSEFPGVKRFHFEWDDFESQGRILGHHLIFLGLGTFLFVGWGATHGFYDPSIGEVRPVVPVFNIIRLLKYGWAVPGFNPFFVDNLEDVQMGHLFVGFLYTLGGVFHILVKPWPYTDRLYRKNADAILAYALGGLAFLGFIACYFTAVNEIAFPPEFFGPVLELRFVFSPYFADIIDTANGMHTSRFWICNFHFYWAFFCLQGHLFHALRGMGFDFRNLPKYFEQFAPEV